MYSRHCAVYDYLPSEKWDSEGNYGYGDNHPSRWDPDWIPPPRPCRWRSPPRQPQRQCSRYNEPRRQYHDRDYAPDEYLQRPRERYLSHTRRNHDYDDVVAPPPRRAHYYPSAQYGAMPPQHYSAPTPAYIVHDTVELTPEQREIRELRRQIQEVEAETARLKALYHFEPAYEHRAPVPALPVVTPMTLSEDPCPTVLPPTPVPMPPTDLPSTPDMEPLLPLSSVSDVELAPAVLVPTPEPEIFLHITEVPKSTAEPGVILLPNAEHRLSPALPRSKRGRFEPKGGRMMRPSPGSNPVQTDPGRPKPWRPPWRP